MAANVAPYGGDEVRRRDRLETQPDARRFLAPLGRLLFTLIFLVSSVGHFSSGTIGYAATMGVPAAGVLVPISGVLALLGGLSILLGFHARAGAWLIVIFLVPVTLMMHRFWGITDPIVAQMQQINFMKNVALTGAALLIAYFGAGPLSLDWRRASRAGATARSPSP